MSEALKTHEQTLFRNQTEIAWRDDMHTWLAEVIDGQMQSRFTYRFNGEDLVARGGQGMGDVFLNAINDARGKAEQNPHLAFELRRRIIELGEYNDMLAMAKGDLPNTMVVVSDFPAELMGVPKDTCGYNTTRKQTMLRVITRNNDGSITATSQSLDQSNRDALEAIYSHLGVTVHEGELLGQRIYAEIHPVFQQELTTTLTRVYDTDLYRQTGVEHFAGRTNQDRRNTMEFAVKQTDLINAYLQTNQDEAAQYKLAAAISARFQNGVITNDTHVSSNMGSTTAMSAIIEMELQGRLAAEAGKTFSGCGGSISMDSAGAQLTVLGYGDSDKKVEFGESDQYGSLTFKCQKGHTNKRPRGKLIEFCKTCEVSVKC